MALSRGHSYGIHTDRTDNSKSYAFVIPLGEFTGGDLVLPSIGYSVPVRPGQILAFTASLLPHYVKEVTGWRYAITAFTDRFTAVRMRNILLALGIKATALNFEA